MSSLPSNPIAMSSAQSAEALFPSHVGQARRSKAGLDVLLTKAAIDFQNLSSEHADALVRLNLEADTSELRDRKLADISKLIMGASAKA